MPVDIRARYYTTVQVAAELGVRRQTVYVMIANGRLTPTLITPTGRLFARGEVKRLKRLREARQRKRRPARTPVP
jgi:excisionase family DNA binding protein